MNKYIFVNILIKKFCKIIVKSLYNFKNIYYNIYSKWVMTYIKGELFMENLTRVKVQEFVTGRYGKCGEFIADVKLKYFKNGKVKKTDFELVKIVETIKDSHGFGKRTMRILEIYQ